MNLRPSLVVGSNEERVKSPSQRALLGLSSARTFTLSANRNAHSAGEGNLTAMAQIRLTCPVSASQILSHFCPLLRSLFCFSTSKPPQTKTLSLHWGVTCILQKMAGNERAKYHFSGPASFTGTSPLLGYSVQLMPDRARYRCSAVGLTPHEFIRCLVLNSTELLVQCCFDEEIVYYLWHVFSGKYIFRLEYNLKSRLRVHQGVRMS